MLDIVSDDDFVSTKEALADSFCVADTLEFNELEYDFEADELLVS